jgi:hypothetical protein
MHRWVWDLHYPAPESTSHEYPISAVPHDTPRYPLGPRALPGKYTARLTANGQTLSQEFTVKMDPRVKTPLAGLEQEFQMQTRLATLMSESAKAVTEVRSVKEQLDKLTGKASGDLSDELKAFLKKVNGVYSGPGNAAESESATPTLQRVNSGVNTLYSQVDRVDAAPTPAQANAAAQFERELPGLLKAWEEIETKDLPQLNQKLRSANLEEIRPELKPSAEEESENQE